MLAAADEPMRALVCARCMLGGASCDAVAEAAAAAAACGDWVFGGAGGA